MRRVSPQRHREPPHWRRLIKATLVGFGRAAPRSHRASLHHPFPRSCLRLQLSLSQPPGMSLRPVLYPPLLLPPPLRPIVRTAAVNLASVRPGRLLRALPCQWPLHPPCMCRQLGARPLQEAPTLLVATLMAMQVSAVEEAVSPAGSPICWIKMILWMRATRKTRRATWGTVTTTTMALYRA